MRGARFDFMVRNFFEMFLRARRALEFSHSQDPQRSIGTQFAVLHNEAADVVGYGPLRSKER